MAEILKGRIQLKDTFFWCSMVAGFGWILYRLLMNQGWILDDEATHYIFSKSVWFNDDQLFNHWTRPGRNWIHCLVAPFGFTAVRIFTLAMAGIAVWLTVLVGKQLGLREIWILPAMVIFQSWFPELSYPVLTQTPFMLCWVLAVWFAMRKNYHLAALCFGYLSLIRHEGILLTALWGIWLSFQAGGFLSNVLGMLRGSARSTSLWPSFLRDAAYGLSTVAPIVVYNLLAITFHGSFPFAVYFESEPTTMYGSGSIFHYVPLLIAGVGYITIVFFVVGLCSLRSSLGKWSLILLTSISYFMLHAIIFWKGAFASGGYYHFLMPMAPFIGLIAVAGFESVLKCLKIRALHLACIIGVPALVVFQGLHMQHHQQFYQDWEAIQQGDAEFSLQCLARPLRQGRLTGEVSEALDWIAEQYPGNPSVLGKHIAVKFYLDQAATKQQQAAEFSPLYQMPVGTLFVWDHLYCEQENRVKFQSFAESGDWEQVFDVERRYPQEDAKAPEQRLSVVVFEKVRAEDKSDKVYQQLGEADKYNSIYE